MEDDIIAFIRHPKNEFLDANKLVFDTNALVHVTDVCSNMGAPKTCFLPRAPSTLTTPLTNL